MRPYILIEDLKGDYQSQHQFLVRNYGNPKQCEFCGITGKKESDGRWSIQWARKRDRDYSHNKDDYHQLCRMCHGKYDLTDEKIAHLRKLANNQTPEQLEKLAAKRSVIAKQRKRINGKFVKKTIDTSGI